MIINANALYLPLVSSCVQTVVTSPPYWGLRDYGVADQLGLESTPEEYVSNLVQVFREVWRVLRDDGTCWINLGDSYASGMRSAYDDDRHKYATARAHDKRPPTPIGLKSKDMVGIPWRVAFALQADGWYLRSDIIWSKPNPMPESVTDRPTKSHEYLFLLTKSERYFYDAEAIREPLQSDPKGWGRHSKKDPGLAAVNPRLMFGPGRDGRDGTEWGDGAKRNRRSVWTVASQPTKEAHFATYPEKLVEPCILAGTSEHGCCSKCGAPWVRVVEKTFVPQPDVKNPEGLDRDGGKGLDVTNGWGSAPRGTNSSRTTGREPSCDCDAGDPIPCLVLDPFVGSGTTGRVAIRYNRRFVGTDLNFGYLNEIVPVRTSGIQRVML